MPTYHIRVLGEAVEQAAVADKVEKLLEDTRVEQDKRNNGDFSGLPFISRQYARANMALLKKAGFFGQMVFFYKREAHDSFMVALQLMIPQLPGMELKDKSHDQALLKELPKEWPLVVERDLENGQRVVLRG